MKKQALLSVTIFLAFIDAAFSLTVCPHPNLVSGSLNQFSLSERETSEFIDRSQVDDARPDNKIQLGIAYQARPDCSSSTYYTQRGCPPGSLAKLTFVKAVLNKFRSGDQGTVWCYYKTPEETMVAVNVNFGRGGTYRIAKPVGGGWNSFTHLTYVCKAYDVASCAFDLEEGELPDALHVRF